MKLKINPNKNYKVPVSSIQTELNKKEISRVEKEYKIKFPKEYQQFLLETNGGKPKDELVFLSDSKIIDPIQINEFLKFSEVESYLEEFRENEELNYIEENMIIIAYADNDLIITICHKGKNKGKVFFVADSDFYFLANSFNEFINNFSPKYPNKFQEAIENGDYTKARKIINSGFDLNTINYYGETVFEVAINHGLMDIVEKCLNEQLEITNLVKKALTSNIEILKLILEKGFDVNQKDENGKTPIFNIIHGGKLEIIELLIKYGAEINIEDYSGNYLIHYAATAKTENLKFLLKKEISFEVKNNEELKPIDLINIETYPENYNLLKDLMKDFEEEKVKRETFLDKFRRLQL